MPRYSLTPFTTMPWTWPYWVCTMRDWAKAGWAASDTTAAAAANGKTLMLGNPPCPALPARSCTTLAQNEKGVMPKHDAFAVTFAVARLRRKALQKAASSRAIIDSLPALMLDQRAPDCGSSRSMKNCAVVSFAW